MFLHLGADTIVSLRHVVGIFDVKIYERYVNDDYLNKIIINNVIEDVADSEPKSVIITDEKIYLSSISSHTLRKRAFIVPENEKSDFFEEFKDMEKMEEYNEYK